MYMWAAGAGEVKLPAQLDTFSYTQCIYTIYRSYILDNSTLDPVLTLGLCEIYHIIEHCNVGEYPTLECVYIVLKLKTLQQEVSKHTPLQPYWALDHLKN